MGIRELLILILGLAVVGVILRGLYVAIQARRGQIRLAIDKNIPQDVDLDVLEMAELPSGGARVVKRSLEAVNRQNAVQDELDLGLASTSEVVPILMDAVEIGEQSTTEADTIDSSAEASTSEAGAEVVQSEVQNYGTRLTEPEEAQVHEQVGEGDATQHQESEFDSYTDTDSEDFLDARAEPGLGDSTEFGEEFDEFAMTAGERIGDSGKQKNSKPLNSNENQGPTSERKETLFTRFGRRTGKYKGQENRAVDTEQKQLDIPIEESRRERPNTLGANENSTRVEARKNFEQVADFKQTREAKKPESVDSKQSRRAIEPSEVLVINVMSKAGEVFYGDELLQVMLTAGLKFGDMDIFHRHISESKNSSIIFSVANILNPGTFNLDNMDQFSTRGVSLFLSMPSAIGNREAFEQMLKTAQQIRSALDGELKDDHRNVMTTQTIEHYRQRVHDFELRKLKAAPAQS